MKSKNNEIEKIKKSKNQKKQKNKKIIKSKFFLKNQKNQKNLRIWKIIKKKIGQIGYANLFTLGSSIAGDDTVEFSAGLGALYDVGVRHADLAGAVGVGDRAGQLDDDHIHDEAAGIVIIVEDDIRDFKPLRAASGIFNVPRAGDHLHLLHIFHVVQAENNEHGFTKNNFFIFFLINENFYSIKFFFIFSLKYWVELIDLLFWSFWKDEQCFLIIQIWFNHSTAGDKHRALPGGATSKRQNRPKTVVSYWWRRLEVPSTV